MGGKESFENDSGTREIGFVVLWALNDSDFVLRGGKNNGAESVLRLCLEGRKSARKLNVTEFESLLRVFGLIMTAAWRQPRAMLKESLRPRPSMLRRGGGPLPYAQYLLLIADKFIFLPSSLFLGFL